MVEVACQTDYVCIVETEPNSEGEEKVRIIEKVVVPEYTVRAIRKYHEKNKEKINGKNNARNIERYHNDPEFRERKKQKELERYHRKKLKEKEESK